MSTDKHKIHKTYCTSFEAHRSPTTYRRAASISRSVCLLFPFPLLSFTLALPKLMPASIWNARGPSRGFLVNKPRIQLVFEHKIKSSEKSSQQRSSCLSTMSLSSLHYFRPSSSSSDILIFIQSQFLPVCLANSIRLRSLSSPAHSVTLSLLLKGFFHRTRASEATHHASPSIVRTPHAQAHPLSDILSLSRP